MLRTSTLGPCAFSSRAAGASLVFKRDAHDLMVWRKAKQPIIKRGPGGRSSVNGHVATVFGATGFLGRYVVSKLAKQGTQVIIPYRDPDEQRHLKVTGDLGQILPMEFDLRRPDQIEETVRHSDVVYNLIGRDYETKNFTFDQVHAQGAQIIAEIVAKYEVPRFIHVSALNADENSPSAFYRTKALGEKLVRSIIPSATIVRPATMFGHEDRFLNRIASGKGLNYQVNDFQQRIRPVHVLDVAQALEIMLNAESTAGQLYELYGTKEYSIEEIYNFASEVIMKDVSRYNMPKLVALYIAKALDVLWWPSTSTDQIQRAFINDQTTPGAKTFADLHIEPQSLEYLALTYLRRYRSTAYFDMPAEKGDGQIKKGVYHVTD